MKTIPTTCYIHVTVVLLKPVHYTSYCTQHDCEEMFLGYSAKYLVLPGILVLQTLGVINSHFIQHSE